MIYKIFTSKKKSFGFLLFYSFIYFPPYPAFKSILVYDKIYLEIRKICKVVDYSSDPKKRAGLNKRAGWNFDKK